MLMTQAARRRADATRNRGFLQKETSDQRTKRIDEMKKRMACAACKSHGKTVFGHWHGDDQCPYKNESKGSKTGANPKAAATFVVTQDDPEASDSSVDVFKVQLCLVDWAGASADCQVWTSSSDRTGGPCGSASGLALSDTACARTVCGAKWISQHVDRMTELGIPFTVIGDEQPFKFGDGPRIISDYAVVFPILVPGCNRVALIRTSVVDQDVPMLVSSPVLKSLAAVLDLGTQTYVFRQLDGSSKMVTTSSGHIGFEISCSDEQKIQEAMHFDWQPFLDAGDEVVVLKDRVETKVKLPHNQGSLNGGQHGVFPKDQKVVMITECDGDHPQLGIFSDLRDLSLPSVIEQNDGLKDEFLRPGSQDQAGICGSLAAEDQPISRGAHAPELGEVEVTASCSHRTSSSQGLARELEAVWQVGTGRDLHQSGDALAGTGRRTHRVCDLEQGPADPGDPTLRDRSAGVGSDLCGGARDGTQVLEVRGDHDREDKSDEPGDILGMSVVPQLQGDSEEGLRRSSSSHLPEADVGQAGCGEARSQSFFRWLQDQSDRFWGRDGRDDASESRQDQAAGGRLRGLREAVLGKCVRARNEADRQGDCHDPGGPQEGLREQVKWEPNPLPVAEIDQRIKTGRHIRRRAKLGTWRRLIGNCKQLAACVFLITAASLSAIHGGSGMLSQAVFGTSRPDLLEVFGGDAEVSLRFSRKGWFVLQPQDVIYGNDLRESSERERLLDLIDKQKPRLVIISYPCRYWTALSNINYRSAQGRRKLARLRRAEHPFLELCSEIFKRQIDRGDDALGENPQCSASFQVPVMAKFLNHPKVFKTVGHGCRYGMKHPKTGQPILKPTLWFCTSEEIIHELSKRCLRKHVHAHCIGGGTTKHAAKYTPEIARAIHKVLLEL